MAVADIEESVLLLDSEPEELVPQAIIYHHYHGRRQSRALEDMTCCEASCQCLKFTFKAIFSSIGLCAVVVGYVLMGGYLFMNIEGNAELKALKAAKDAKDEHQNAFVNNVTKYIQQYLIPCPEYPVSMPPEDVTQPSLANENSTMYDASIKPTTVNSPIKPRCHPNVDEILSKIRIYVKERLVEYEEPASGKKSSTHNDSNSSSNNTNLQIKWTIGNSVLYATTVITTIGYGNLVPQTVTGKVVTMFYAIIGVPLMLITLASMGSFMATCFRFCYQRCCSPLCSCLMRLCQPPSRSRRRQKNRNNATQSPGEGENGHEGNDKDSLDIPLRPRRKKQKEIPIYLSVVVLTTYLISIAALFKFWENWDWLKAIYFCFITFSTIGFGDIVPGHSLIDERENSYKAALCAVAVLFGLVVMSMSFTLMQDTIFSYFRSCCRKIRSIGGNEEETDDREESYLSVMESPQPVSPEVIQNAKKKGKRKKLEQSPV